MLIQTGTLKIIRDKRANRWRRTDVIYTCSQPSTGPLSLRQQKRKEWIHISEGGPQFDRIHSQSLSELANRPIMCIPH